MQFGSVEQDIHINGGALSFWSWNDQLEKDELRRQLEDFSRGRFSGVLVHSRGGLRIPYMGKEWFDCYRFVINEARRLGLEVWIYDEDGWPSGFAGGRVPAMGEKHWLKQLHFSQTDTGIPENRVAAWKRTADGYRPVPKETAESGDLICWYTADKNYVDLLSRETVRCFIECTHERYRQEIGGAFGDVVKGVFTDEPQIAPYPWSTVLEDAWLSRYHTPLTDRLYLLVLEEAGFEQFRRSFRELVSDLLYESFTKQISEWCRQNRLIFTGHFSEEDGLAMQMHGNGGTMRHYPAMQMPGIDHLGNRYPSPILLKQPSSVAHQLGKSDVLSETYGCAGWEITFDRLCRIWGRESVLGITKPCFHLSAYSITGRRKRDYPAFYSYQEPWWDQFPAVTRWIDGLDSLMREGERLSDVLVISPLGAVAAAYDTKRAEKISCEYRCLVENLLDAQVDVELGDEKIIAEHGRIEDGDFWIGQASYRLVIVPEAGALTEKTLSLLCEYAQQGGRIWYCGDRPPEAPDGEVVQNRRDMLEKCLSYIGYQRPIALYVDEYGTLLHGVLLHTRRLDGGYRCHIWAGSGWDRKQITARLYAPGDENMLCRVDIASQERSVIPCQRDGDFLTAAVELPSDSSIVLEWQHSGGTVHTACQKTFLKEYAVTDCTIGLEADNALTLDYASVSVNGAPFSEKQPVLHMLCGLYREREALPPEQPMRVRLRYDFDCDGGWDMSGVSVVFEDEFVLAAELNGKRLSGSAKDWWIDRKFHEYAIGSYLHSGNNTLILHYELPQSQRGTETTGFESERNRFFFPVEPDSVYIKGNFDVVADAAVIDRGGFYRVGGSFRLTAPTEKQMGDITVQNAWFYRGNLVYRFSLFCPDRRTAYRLSLEETHGTGAEVLIGDRTYTMLSFREPLDITEALLPGENTVTVRLLGHNRNLLGPHHHIKGETTIVGPDTFEGRRGFEDFVSPDVREENTWTDSYHFIPFGCGRIKIGEEQTIINR